MNEPFLSSDECQKLWSCKKSNEFTIKTEKLSIRCVGTLNRIDGHTSLPDGSEIVIFSDSTLAFIKLKLNDGSYLLWKFDRFKPFGENHGIEWNQPLPCSIKRLSLMMLETMRNHTNEIFAEKLRLEQEEAEKVERRKQEAFESALKAATELLMPKEHEDVGLFDEQ